MQYSEGRIGRVFVVRFAEALESLYDRILQEKADPALVSPFAGIASVACAEVHRRARAYDKAIASYGRAIAHDERAIQADAAIKETADPAVALALAGRARCSYELGDDTSALNDILASLARHPGSAGTCDGMGMTPGETAQMLLARLRKQEKAAEARLLEEALATIDPDLLRPDYGLGEPK